MYIKRADATETFAELYDIFDDCPNIVKELHKVYDKILAIPSAEPTVDKDYLVNLIQEAVYDGEACKRLTEMVEPKQGEWIPCNERPPEEEGIYLVTWMPLPKPLKGADDE